MPGNNNNNNNNSSNNNNSNVSENNSTFYEETPNVQYVATNTMKRPVSLDLNSESTKNPAKKQRVSLPTPLVLDSTSIPSMTTPDIEKFILNNLQTPTTATAAAAAASEVLFPQTKATAEQQKFVGGFYEVLESLHHKNDNKKNPTAHTLGMSGGSFTYTNLDDSYPVAVKDEPETAPGSPTPHIPIDMENQEKIKLERKRQRNRVAASKCRKRKLERISKLEDKVKCLKNENVDLSSVVKQLKGHVFQLKQQVIDHINTGCSIPLYNGATILQSK